MSGKPAITSSPSLPGVRPGGEDAHWFNAEHYLSQLVEPASICDPWSSFDQLSRSCALSPSVHFDAAYYLQVNADVREAGDNPLTHYLDVGRDEGRSPLPSDEFRAGRDRNETILGSFIDGEFYRRFVPDLSATKMDPSRHYLALGHAGDIDVRPDFSVPAYRDRHRSAIAAGSHALLDYLKTGIFEGRGDGLARPASDPSGERTTYFVSKLQGGKPHLRIVASRPDGLGTRLLTTLHARALAERLGIDLFLTWASLEDENYAIGATGLLQESSAGEVFPSGFAFALDGRPYGEITRHPAPERRALVFNGARGLLATMTLAEFMVVSDGFDYILYDLPLAFECRDLKEDRGAIKRYWTEFAFDPKVTDAFAAFSARHDLAHACVVHLRRGDLINILLKSSLETLAGQAMTVIFQRFLPLATAAREVLDVDPYGTGAVIVCSEDASAAQHLERQLGRPVFATQGVFEPGSNHAALCDLMILAGAGTLVAPYQSFFSECAATVGRCRYRKTDLDIAALSAELLQLVDDSGCADAAARRAIIHVASYQNLWWHTGGTERARHLALAREADPAIVATMLPDHASV